MNVFLAHPRGMAGAEIDAAIARLRVACEGAGKQAVVVPGRDDFKQFAAARGGWVGWPQSIATLNLGEPRYNLIIVWPDLIIGRGTFAILVACSKAARPVFLWNGEGGYVKGKSFKAVTGIHETKKSPSQWAYVTVKDD